MLAVGDAFAFAGRARVNDALARLSDIGDDRASPTLRPKEKVEGDEHVDGPYPTFDFDFDQSAMDADRYILGEYLIPNHVPTLPIGEGAASPADASTFCFVGVQAWDRNRDRANLAAFFSLSRGDEREAHLRRCVLHLSSFCGVFA